MAKINLTEDDVNRSKSVEKAGWHPVKVEKHVQKAAKTDQSALYVYTLKVQDGEYKGINVFAQFSEKAMGFFVPFLKAVGVPVTAKGIANFDTEFPVGKSLEVYIKPEEYNGKMQNKVADFRPVGAARK